MSIAWLPGGDELFYVRRLAPGQAPPGEEAFHRRVSIVERQQRQVRGVRQPDRRIRLDL